MVQLLLLPKNSLWLGYSRWSGWFYKAPDGKTIPAKCAYIEVANSANSAKFYSLGDHSGSTTGITSVKNEAAGNNAPMYNLAGQLVDKGYKGIVIKNGKRLF